MATIEEIKENIQHWNEIRNETTSYDLLTSGLGVALSSMQYEQFEAIRLSNDIEENDFNIHAYLGVKGANLFFYLIDSSSDAEDNYDLDQTLFEKLFTGTSSSEAVLLDNENPINSSANSISHQAAHTRHTAWTTEGAQWFETVSKNKDVVRFFKIPFLDFKAIFDQEGVENAFLFLGLTNTTNDEIPYKQQIEIITCSQYEGETGISFDKKHLFEDITIPYPPF
jgi:hypothetical protein